MTEYSESHNLACSSMSGCKAAVESLFHAHSTRKNERKPCADRLHVLLSRRINCNSQSVFPLLGRPSDHGLREKDTELVNMMASNGCGKNGGAK
jgi:hypothetical protein